MKSKLEVIEETLKLVQNAQVHHLVKAPPARDWVVTDYLISLRNYYKRKLRRRSCGQRLSKIESK